MLFCYLKCTSWRLTSVSHLSKKAVFCFVFELEDTKKPQGFS